METMHYVKKPISGKDMPENRHSQVGFVDQYCFTSPLYVRLIFTASPRKAFISSNVTSTHARWLLSGQAALGVNFLLPYVSIINKFLEKHTKEHVNIFLRFRFRRDTIPRDGLQHQEGEKDIDLVVRLLHSHRYSRWILM